MAEYLSELTKKTLQQFNWIEGDPIPENLGALFAQIHERSPASKSPGLYVDVKGMSQVDIDAVNAALADAKVLADKRRQQKEADEKTAGLSPEMIALQKNIENAAEHSTEIIDDRREAKQPEPAPEQTAAKTETATTTEIPEVTLSEKPVQEVFCPRCNWDMRMKYDIEMTEADKEVFIASVLGGTRMQKSYSIMKDRYIIKFRGLTAEENKKIHRQLLVDQKNDEFQSDTEWFLKFFEYRLACSVETVAVDDKILAMVPELDDIKDAELPSKTDDKNLPPLVRLRNYVLGDLFKMEITRRLVSGKFREFQRLYETLEAMAVEPNFW